MGLISVDNQVSWLYTSLKCHCFFTNVAAKLLQSCPTLCNPWDGSPLGSPVPGILQARTLEWVAISFSNAWKWKVKVKSLSCVQLLATPWTAAYQAPLSMGFSMQEYRSGVPLPSPLLMLFNPSYILIGQKKHSLQFSAFFPSHQQVLFLWSPWNRHWSIGNWTMKQIISFMIIMNYH